MSQRLMATFDPLELLRRLGGYYECPRNEHGDRIGPLVGYAGRDSQGRQYVGDVYANFAKAEQHPRILDEWAQVSVATLPPVSVCLGMPMGGILFASALARARDCRTAFAEKKVLAVGSATEREKSKLVLGRHDLSPGDDVILVEDVVNNFSTTDSAMRLVADHGAKVVAVASILNRSGQDFFTTSLGASLPVFSLVNRPFPQYQQDDPAVAGDVRAGRVVWKPKDEWHNLSRFAD